VSLDWLDPFTSTLDVNSIRGAAIEQLGHWIADSPVLDSLHLLVSAGLETRELQNVVVQCFARFLQWKSERGSIKLKSLSLHNIDVHAEVIATLLRENPHLTTFSMTSCFPHQGSFATEALASAHVAQNLASITSVSSLTLDLNFRNEVYFSAILEALAIGESSVETLAIHFSFLTLDLTTLQAITNFFDTLAARHHNDGRCANGGRCCLRAVHFRGFHWTVDLLSPLVTSIRAATTPSAPNACSSIQLEEIGMHSCVIDHFAMVSLSSLFAVVDDDYRTTIHTLSITESRLFDAPVATQNLVGTSPGLHNLHLPFLITFARGQGPRVTVMCRSNLEFVNIVGHESGCLARGHAQFSQRQVYIV
jgi:hypothetical protein